MVLIHEFQAKNNSITRRRVRTIVDVDLLGNIEYVITIIYLVNLEFVPVL